MDLTLSKDFNPNYVARVVEITVLNPHPNADRLQIATINFKPVIVGLDTKIGDIGIYICGGSQLCDSYLHEANMYSSCLKNKNTELKGYIGDKGRVKTIKLRQEPTDGLFIPQETFGKTYGYADIKSLKVGDTFDMVDGEWFIKKYEKPIKEQRTQLKNGQKPRLTRMIDGQFYRHIKTENLRNVAYKLKLDDIITLSYKLHGTSAIFANTRVKRQLSWIEKLGMRLGINVRDDEFDSLYSSRRVVQNDGFEQKQSTPFYKTDVYSEINELIAHNIPKNYAVYGEIVGYQSNGSGIQGDYDYGNGPTEKSFHPYRVTITNHDGIVYNLPTNEVVKFAEKIGFTAPEVFYNGTVEDWLVKNNIATDSHWQENMILELQHQYNDRDCYMCKNAVPEEGIILRIEKTNEFEAYKLKSMRFLLKEEKSLDSNDNLGASDDSSS